MEGTVVHSSLNLSITCIVTLGKPFDIFIWASVYFSIKNKVLRNEYVEDTLSIIVIVMWYVINPITNLTISWKAILKVTSWLKTIIFSLKYCRRCSCSFSKNEKSILSVGIHWETSLNINLEINNERQVCKIGAVMVGFLWKGEWRRLRWGNMVDGVHIWNRTKKPLAVPF
jgi:hypothetical protein